MVKLVFISWCVKRAAPSQAHTPETTELNWNSNKRTKLCLEDDFKSGPYQAYVDNIKICYKDQEPGLPEGRLFLKPPG